MRALANRFLNFNQVAFWPSQGAENEFKVSWEHFKHRFIDFIQVAKCSGQESENVFKEPFDHLKHRFIDFFQVWSLRRWSCGRMCSQSLLTF